MSETVEQSLTVIVPTWNQCELLCSCLRSLGEQTRKPSVLVIDNGSRDHTTERIAQDFPAVSCLQLSENQGFAKAVNRGILHSRTPYIALLNNDTEADRRWVEAGMQGLNNQPSHAFFASRIIRFQNRSQLDSAGDCYTRGGLPYKRGLGLPPDTYSLPEPVLGASAGAAFYRREVFDAIGLFDEDFYMYLEDVEWSLRAQSAGFSCLYLPDAVVYHWEAASDPHRPSARAPIAPDSISRKGVTAHVYYSPTRVYWITRNRWLLMVLYQHFRHAPWLIAAWTKSSLFHLIRAGNFGAFLKGLAGGLGATPAFLKKRRHLRRKMVVSHRELCEKFKAC